MTVFGKLLKEMIEVLYGLEISERRVIIEGDNNYPNQMFVSFEGQEEIYLPYEEEYKRALQVLHTWLENAPQFVKSKGYIRKEIQTTEYDNAYMYTFKKINKNEYILVNKKALK